MDLSDDLPPPRRALFFPVVIATVFLTIIGMSAGIGLASWHQSQKTDNQSQSTSTPTADPTTTTAAPSGESCREETQLMGAKAGAQGVLRIRLLLRTKSSDVWICQDDAGQYYYHGKRGGDKAPWVENQTALFLTGVQRVGDGVYEATAADGTQFSITAARLRIVHKDGQVETQWAVG